MMKNETNVEEFILEGFPAVQHLGKLLFVVLLMLYLVSIIGNTVIVIIMWVDHRLQIPMYLFLSGFSFLECCFTTSVIPKLLSIFLSGMQTISFAACLTQAFVFISIGITGFFLMAVMSIDRYMAICNPLHYPSIMTMRVCFLLILFCCSMGTVATTSLIIKVSQLSFCDSNIIKHFLCDLGPLTQLSCSDTSFIQSLTFFLALFIILSSLAVTIICYVNIAMTIMHLPSAKERQKAFSTCSSHLIVLFLIYGSCIFIYIKPNQANRLDTNKEAALMNTVVTPALNPFIYTLRNKQFRLALRDTIYKMKLLRQSRP
ncbi:olfactory receptor 6C2-like [Dromiciops gliroides]|uniref:olfactory receptor 6C2-like n=1 Tax=Dromiciops gliroides TaxID=33562 RepID=UPI001CC5CFA0|nr:olfactory receptor 6C2-like [Dromiciops gliroides]